MMAGDVVCSCWLCFFAFIEVAILSPLTMSAFRVTASNFEKEVAGDDILIRYRVKCELQKISHGTMFKQNDVKTAADSTSFELRNLWSMKWCKSGGYHL